MQTIQKHFKIKKEEIKSTLVRFTENYAANQFFDEELRAIMTEQVSRRTNISAIETKVLFADRNDILNIRLTLFLNKNFSIYDLVESFTQEIKCPFRISLNSYYLCYTRDRDLYLVHPTINTSLDYGLIYGKEDYQSFLDKLRDNDAFIESLLTHHENVLSIDGEGIFRRSGFSFLRMVALEAYVKYFDSSDFQMQF